MGRAAAEIQCSLTTFDFDQAPPYEALSYVWGAPDPSVMVKCNGFPKEVGPNLAAALRQIRQAYKKTKLDLCGLMHCASTRSDPKERSSQVAFMQDIFGRAERV
jgi:uncharacterized pyridoxal phosphate-containing UPF0001 family protein